MTTNYLPQSRKSTEVDPKSYTVLIADDDRIMANLLAVNVRRLGHRVAGIAWNGKEAVAMSLKMRPDVVIMDIHMPVLDGIQAAAEILNVRVIPIVLSTGLADSKTVRRASDLRLVSYLVKPFGPNQLKVALQLAIANVRALAIPPDDSTLVSVADGPALALPTEVGLESLNR
jgi:response regulator NasT